MGKAPDGTAEQQLGPYVEPVQLQVVCFRLWEKPRRDLTKITVDEVAATGDVDSALAEFYSERVQQVAQNSGVSERAIREWFDRALITEAGIRSEVMKGPESNGGRTEVAIQELQSTHLVRREERRGVTWLELSHVDSLGQFVPITQNGLRLILVCCSSRPRSGSGKIVPTLFVFVARR